MIKGCEHKFIYGGVKYENTWQRSGSSARNVFSYFDWFYCEKCLENRYIKLDYHKSSYDKTPFNATPMPDKRER